MTGKEPNIRNQATLWDHEYDHGQIIPSSRRPQASKALVLYERLFNFGQISPVLDAGCGNGRNAIYFAHKGCQVEAVDFSQSALRLARQRVSEAGLADKICVSNQWLHDQWSFADGIFGLALDSYVLCHLLRLEEREKHRRELWRVIRPAGLLYSSVFCTDDAYYAELSDGKNPIVCDPRNGIEKHLYTEEEFREFFSEYFKVVYFTKFQFDDSVCGQIYRRSILTLLAEK